MQASTTSAVVAGAQRIGVVGCGLMGRGIAQIAAQAGDRVVLLDKQPGAADKARDSLRDTWERLAARGKLDAGAAERALANVTVASALADLRGCDVVVEAIVEDLAIKRALFAELEEVLGLDAILATNTSSLSVTAIAAGLAKPQRVAGFHFFSPVPLMKIVEVVDGLLTDAAVGDRLLALGARWGHTAVRTKDTPGFIVNHAGRGFGTEGLRILAEAVAEHPVLDRILRDCAGFRLGPCELLDLTGLDVSAPVMDSIYHQYYEEPRFRPQPLLRTRLAAGLLGRKSGCGFYRYDADGKAEPVPERPVPPVRADAVWVSRARPALAERVVALLRALGATVSEAERPGDGDLIVVTPLGDDATTCAARERLDARRTVAVDALFDLARRRVVMSTPATAPEWRERALGRFGADGTPVDAIRDSAGLVAQRVVAHIVNIACEIAQLGIAAPADIDRAVTLGLGYPRGPLAWGDALDPAVVLEILENLQAATGDPRYRPSSWLRRRATLGLSLLTPEL